MDETLRILLACPLCKGELDDSPTKQELVCRRDRLAFPIIDGIPVMIASEARKL